MSSDIAIDRFLKHFACWNSKKTIARCPLFALPLNLLYDESAAAPTESSSELNVADLSIAPVAAGAGLTCRACSLVFENLSAQRIHFKSNLHILNLQRKIRGLPILEFEPTSDPATIKELGDPESFKVNAEDDAGCENEIESEEENEPDETCLDTASNQPESGSGVDGEFTRTVSGVDGPLVTYKPSRHPGWEMTCSEILLSSITSAFGIPCANPWDSLIGSLRHLRDYSQLWSILVLRSGKFAGAVFDGDTVLAHKVFRRYTIRAKSGGSQSSHDNQHGKAASAGAMMRRHGEAMLREDVGKLMTTWQAHFQSCFCILMACPKTMKNVFFDEESRDPPLRKDDKRIRNIPFMVGTPTFEELLRIKDKCSQVVFRRIQVSATVVDAEFASSLPSATATIPESIDGLGNSEISHVSSVADELVPIANCLVDSSEVDMEPVEVEAIPTNEILFLPSCPASQLLVDACVGGDENRVHVILSKIRKLDAIRRGWDDEDSVFNEDEIASACLSGLTSDNDKLLIDIEAIGDLDLDEIVNLPSSLSSMETPLHIASRMGNSGIIGLLIDAGADPCRIDVRGRYPYMLAKDKNTRDAFRKARAMYPDRWDWDSAGVPAALTAELEKAQKDKEKEKKKRAKAKKKDEKEKEERVREDAQRAALAHEETKRAELEYAKQAAMNAAGVCASCGISLFHIDALEVFDVKCCSNNCVIRYRRKLAADAALARIQNKTK